MNLRTLILLFSASALVAQVQTLPNDIGASYPVINSNFSWLNLNKITGPGSAVANHIPQFSDTSGKALKDGLAVSATATASTVVQRNSSGEVIAVNTPPTGNLPGFFGSAPAGSKCLHSSGTTGLITEAAADCGAGGGGTGNAADLISVTHGVSPTYTSTTNTANTFVLQTVSAENVTGGTFTSVQAGEIDTWTVCQPTTGTPVTYVYPANVLNGGTIGSALNTCTYQRGTVDGSGNLNLDGTTVIKGPGVVLNAIAVDAVLPSVLYSAAGTPLPSCAASLNGATAIVSDAGSPSYMGAYSSGGTVTAAVICSYSGSTYSWLTH
jgi:hypothetical protein